MEGIMAYATKYSLGVSLSEENENDESYRFYGGQRERQIIDLTGDDEDEDEEESPVVFLSHIVVLRHIVDIIDLTGDDEELDLDEIYREGKLWFSSELELEQQREEDERSALDAGFEAVWSEYVEKRGWSIKE